MFSKGRARYPLYLKGRKDHITPGINVKLPVFTGFFIVINFLNQEAFPHPSYSYEVLWVSSALDVQAFKSQALKHSHYGLGTLAESEWLVEHFTLITVLWQEQKGCTWKIIYQEAFDVFLGSPLKQFSGWKARERRSSSWHTASSFSVEFSFGTSHTWTFLELSAFQKNWSIFFMTPYKQQFPTFSSLNSILCC